MAKEKGKPKVSTEGGDALEQNPFESALGELESEGLPSGRKPGEPAGRSESGPAGGGGRRLEIRRETRGRGGKTVTVISGFPPSFPEWKRRQLLKSLQDACATGGSVQTGAIEIQGDHRETVLPLLSDAGYRPVPAGG